MKKISLLKKIKKYMLEKWHRKILNPKIFMTLLVKNEADIIEENLIYHKNLGIDGFIVTDNLSTDGTLEILERYRKKGWIKELIIEKSDKYQQSEWVDRMIKIILQKYEADWIINADADEFWTPKNMDLKKTLSKMNGNVLICKHWNVIPEDEKIFYKNKKIIKNKIDNIENYNLSKYSLYNKQDCKVMHRAKGYKKISGGNHKVEIALKSEKIVDEIAIFHYGIRGLNQFSEKMKNGYKVLTNNEKLEENFGTHWRYFGKIVEKGDFFIKEEYEKIIGKNYIPEFLKNGIIEEDDSVEKMIEMLKIKNKI